VRKFGKEQLPNDKKDLAWLSKTTVTNDFPIKWIELKEYSNYE